MTDCSVNDARGLLCAGNHLVVYRALIKQAIGVRLLEVRLTDLDAGDVRGDCQNRGGGALCVVQTVD